MQRKLLMAANWKMNHGVEDTLKFLTHFMRQPLTGEADVVICPPFVSLYTAGIALQDSGLKMGAQNCHFEESGAFTGETSAAFLKEVGCDYVIVGHSERRQIFKETDADIAKKLSKVFEHGMTPIFCVGETAAEREAAKTFPVIETQLRDGLALLEKEQIGQLVVAYEPVWAIGTGNTATPGQAQEVHAFIRQHVERHFGTSFGKSLRILYGGSVKPDNARALMAQADIDGGLVGGASLKPDEFLEIIRQGAEGVKS